MASLPKPSAKPFAFGCVLLLVILEIGGFLYTRDRRHWNDFRSYYTAGLIARTCPHNLYDTALEANLQEQKVGPGFLIPFLHPAFEATLYAPLSLLPFRAAYLAFIAADCLLLAGVFFFTRPLFEARIPWLQAWPGAVLLYFPAVAAVILWGQDSLLFLFLCSLCWRLLAGHSDARAGIAMGLALFRFQFALPLAVLLIVRRGRRFAMGFLLTALVLAGLSYAIAGTDALVRYGHLLTSASLVHDHTVAAQHAAGARPASMPNLEGLLYVLAGRHLGPHSAFGLTLAVSGLLFGFAAYRMRVEPEDDPAFAVAVLSAALVSYHLYPYDVAITLLPIVLLARRLSTAALLTLFWSPVALLLVLHPRGLFLYGLVLLAVVFLASRSSRAIADNAV